MESQENVCYICSCFSVKYYQLENSIRPPSDLYFEGCADFHGILQKILKLNGERKNSASHICQQCHDEFRRIYTFMNRCAESEKIFCQQNTSTGYRCMLITKIKEEFDEHLMGEDDEPLKIKSLVADDVNYKADNFSSPFDLLSVKECDADAVMKSNIDSSIRENINAAEDSGESQIEKDFTSNEATFEDLQLFKIEELSIEYSIMDKEEGDAFVTTVEGKVPITNPAKFSCKKCSKKFASDVGLRNHTRIIHDRRWYNCDQCDLRYKHFRSLKAHKQTHTGEIFRCDECDHQFPAELYLKDHKQGFHSGKTFECNACQITFPNRSSLYNHKRVHTAIQYRCDQCDKEYLSEEGLRTHKFSHIGASLKCGKCDACFWTKSTLREHMQTHPHKSFDCDQCDAKYHIKRSLHKHMLSKHSNVRFECDQCNATFKTREGFKLHEQSHAGVVFKCDQCNAVFKSKKGLRNHRIAHIGLQCDQCDNRFYSRKVLKQHLERHWLDKKLSSINVTASGSSELV